MNSLNLPCVHPVGQPAPTPPNSLPPNDGQPPSVQPGAFQSTPVPLVLTVDEAAARLHVSTKTIRRLLDRGYLTASKVLRKKLIPRQQIEAFLKATCDAPKVVR